ncbi:YbfB/YjiJ family MFS transporter [Mesorhizobium sp.]|uniref:YbfB/YjiJ family MFS transporter n=1 Tax=Mesorhizobium sp. TaxID=1871066 RepID=UPI000FE347AB|nr:YbfB/YjiJ family MFS transporter [Mesorhizobium sp.]RWN58144.1 MAG: MFS transporter [Mesorhizobium sp.]RWN79148.1 MAG: MFS transporter [Mesorhizobium sp.]RWN84707.1 MAG: MFS transporter [Mesorhizobium sp.]RWN92825.1 MAG: MFS transporter [Mesorhizobium sp.]RWO17373.1 MAG: MFS transporter [Mesorhizobium sp.]
MNIASPSPLRLAFAGMIALAVAMGIGRFVYTPILPGMMEELGLTPADAGWIASANYLGYLVGALAAVGGWAHGRERLLMLAGLAATAVLTGLMGLADTMAAFLVIRFLAGVASAFVLVFMSSIVFGHLAAVGRNDLQALHFGGVGLGIAASSALMAILVTGQAGWPAGWFWSAAISACAIAVVALLLGSTASANGADGREPALPKDRSLVKVIVAYGLFGFGYIVTATFLVAIVRQGGGGRVFEAVVWMVTGLAGIPSVWLWQKIAAKIGLYRAYAWGCLVEVVGVSASVTMGGHVGPLLGGFLLGGTFIAITALGLQSGRQLAPQAPRRTLALMTASFGLGQIIGPIVAGLLAEASGDFFLASIVAAAVLLVSGAVIWSAAPKSP